MMRDMQLPPEEIADSQSMTFVSVATSIVAVYFIGVVWAGPVMSMCSASPRCLAMPLWYYVGRFCRPSDVASLALFLISLLLASA